jgi:hypothetical protein
MSATLHSDVNFLKSGLLHLTSKLRVEQHKSKMEFESKFGAMVLAHLTLVLVTLARIQFAFILMTFDTCPHCMKQSHLPT